MDQELTLNQTTNFKGGYLDFSHLTELKDIYITEMYMEKQYKLSIIKNHKIRKKIFFFFDVVPLKGYIASYVIFRFCDRNPTSIVEKSSD